MTALLSPTSATASTATEGDVKTYLTNLRDFIADLLGTDSTNKAAVAGLLGAILNGKITKTAAYTVVAADRGKVIDCTGSWTMNIAAATTLGDGFVFAVRNSGTGAVTIDPNLTEQINGQATKVISAGEFLIVYCDGTSFSTVGGATQNPGFQIFTSGGTFTVPAGVTAVRAYVVGGGGGGGTVGGASSQYRGGGGGGAGGVAMKLVTGLVVGATVSVTVGAGGAADAAGGTSSFGSHAVASGGAAGSSVSADVAAGGGAGGAGSAGDVVGKGMPGQDSYPYPDGPGFLPGRGGSTSFHTLSGLGGGNSGAGEKYGAGGNGGIAYTGSSAGYAGAGGVVLVEW